MPGLFFCLLVIPSDKAAWFSEIFIMSDLSYCHDHYEKLFR